ncbi:MAG: Wzz/FepE/Etk N-terminal domain-containing protein [Candidatus Gastranaerophilales bacterium]|nr:Wzz/FepE/Etk N-terminal domain-containing protein [Candidatus Gastranaerophilales bacterium]
MNNSDYFENEEKTINLTKIWHIFLYRKKIIFFCFLLSLFLCSIFTIICPKIYLSEVKILINKNNSTYLSDINPFALSETKSDGLLKFSSKDNLNNEIEIIKSPIVLDNVIRENGIKYEKGSKVGKYLYVKDFLKKDFSIENLKDTNILKISYKSKDPTLSYNVIRSILTNYRTIYENINIIKASNDKNFLMKSYSKAKDAVENKITKLKQFKSRTITASDTALNNMNILLRLQDRRINKDASSISQLSVENKKLEAELDQELENLKNLKSKYEWSRQIESMSKGATNLIILEEPAISDISHYSEPKPLFNIFIALIFSTILSYFVILYKEKTDKKLSYIALNEDFELINTKKDLHEIKNKIILSNIDNLGIISLVNKEFTDNFSELIKQDSGYKMKVEVTSENSSLNEYLNVINSSDNLVFIGHIGVSDRKIYNGLKSSAKKLDKKIIGEFVCKNNAYFKPE